MWYDFLENYLFHMKKLISLVCLVAVLCVSGGIAIAEDATECSAKGPGFMWQTTADGTGGSCIVNEDYWAAKVANCSGSGGTPGGSGACTCPQGMTYDGDYCKCSADKSYTGENSSGGIVCMNQTEWASYMADQCASRYPETPDFDFASGQCYNKEFASGSLIPAPSAEFDYAKCEALFNYSTTHLVGEGSLHYVVKSGEKQNLDLPPAANGVMVSPLDILGCAVMTGNVSFWMVPFYIKYLIQFALSIAGLIAVLGIIIGGYYYFFGGLSDDKDKGKRSIIYGIAGFVLAILSWALVNIVISALTR